MTDAFEIDRDHSARDGWQAGGSFGDIVARLYRQGHITDRLLAASVRFIADLQRSHGSSGPLVSAYGERLSVTDFERAPNPSGDIDAWNRASRVLRGLNSSEHEVFSWLVLAREHRAGGLAALGRARSGYEAEEVSRACAVGIVRALLERVATYY